MPRSSLQLVREGLRVGRVGKASCWEKREQYFGKEEDRTECCWQLHIVGIVGRTVVCTLLPFVRTLGRKNATQSISVRLLNDWASRCVGAIFRSWYQLICCSCKCSFCQVSLLSSMQQTSLQVPAHLLQLQVWLLPVFFYISTSSSAAA